MGRITVFALEGCPHCAKAKGALKERGIPFTEINLSSHADRLTDMLSLCDNKPTVPQIFFNENLLGGIDDLQRVLDQWDIDGPLDRYKEEIEGLPNPLDRRLAPPPATPAEDEKPPPPRNEAEDAVRTPGPNGSKISVLKVTLQLMDCMPCKDLSFRGKMYKKSFTGSDGVTAIVNKYELGSRDVAVFFGKLLQRRKIISHVTGDHEFGDNGNYYRLRPYENPSVLNSFRLWTDRVDPDPLAIVLRLKKQLTKIETRHTDSKGDINYLGMAADNDFWTFEENCCELQKVNLKDMDERTKLAFGINVYNLMIKHGFVKVGIPATNVQRQQFFNRVFYDIGRNILSYSELEHGILRGNAKPPSPTVLAPPFPKNDPRLDLVVKKVDARIHFALNCGAKSCPPVKTFTAGNIDNELNIVALAFCDDPYNVSLDEHKGEASLSKIFKWYQPDFSTSVAKLPERIVQYLQGDKKAKLQKMMSGGKTPKIKFVPYDWSTNASQFQDFKPDNLEEDVNMIRGMFASITANK